MALGLPQAAPVFGRVAGALCWQQVDVEPSHRRDDWIAEAKSIWQSANDRYIEQNVEWMQSADGEPRSRTSVFELRNAEHLCAYAIAQAGLMHQLWIIRGKVLCHRTVERLRIVRGAVLDTNQLESERAASAFVDLLIGLNQKFPQLPISLEAFRPEPDTRVILNDRRIRSRFLALPAKTGQTHYAIDLPNSIYDYMQQLNCKERQNVRRHLRRLEERCDGDLHVEHYRDEGDVRSFLKHALPIAKTTWQYRAYNSGLAAEPGALVKYTAIAQKGWWRGHVLFCKNRPVAYLVGYEIDGTYFGEQIGYDPTWARYGIGILAMVSLTESLIVRDKPPGRYDFGPGAQDYKRHLANYSWPECSYDLVPRTAQMLPFVAAYVGKRAIEKVRNAAKQLGVRTRKDLVRQKEQSGEVDD